MVIIGSGGLAREVLMVVRDINRRRMTWNVLGFIDENKDMHGKIICDFPVLGSFRWIEENANDNLYVVIGVGNPKIRKKWIKLYANIT